MKEFHIDFRGCCRLSESEIWPDGDVPENPTAKDVIDKIKSIFSSKGSFIDCWNLGGDLEIEISDGKKTKYWY